MLKYYSIFDKKTGAYATPQETRHEADIVRSIQQHLAERKGKLFIFAGDYALYHVFDFEESSGVATQSKPKFIMELAALLPPMEAPNAKA